MTYDKSDLVSFGNYIDKRSHQKIKVKDLFDVWEKSVHSTRKLKQ